MPLLPATVFLKKCCWQLILRQSWRALQLESAARHTATMPLCATATWLQQEARGCWSLNQYPIRSLNTCQCYFGAGYYNYRKICPYPKTLFYLFFEATRSVPSPSVLKKPRHRQLCWCRRAGLSCQPSCAHTTHTTYIHTCTHAYMRTYCKYAHTCIHDYMLTRIHTYMHAYIHTYIHTYVYTHNVH